MRNRDIITGTVVAVIVFIFLFFALRSCTRSDDTATAATVEGEVAGDHLTPCDADRETGICYPERKVTEAYDWERFMAMVYAHQKVDVVSSSSSSLSVRCVGCSGTFSSRTSSSRGASGGTLIGRSYSSSSFHSYRSYSSGGGVYVGGGSSSFGGTGTLVSSGTGSFVGYGGLQGSLGPLPSGKCSRGRSLLSIFDDDRTTGTYGFTFPVLIDGNCPITAAILKWPESENGFGGPLNDF